MAAGSLGMVIFSPITQALITNLGWHDALVGLAVISIVVVPLALLLPNNPDGGVAASVPGQTVVDAVREAARHRGYVLLTTGFFVCGFHVTFISVHFPAYISDLGLNPTVAAWSLALIGLFNIGGSFVSGFAGQRWSKKAGLSFIYTGRAIAIVALLLLPKTEMTMYVFAGAMGLLWLSTVPLTTGIVAQVFGVRYFATLSGIVFFSHQVGSFLGAWLGGVVYDRTGSYDGMWIAGIVLGVAAALIHLPINESPLVRLRDVA
jgi:predicted MFS family arabinose efflux permease